MSGIWERLADAVRGKSVVPALPEGKLVVLPDHDDVAEAGVEAAPDVDVIEAQIHDETAIPLAIFIEYRDSKGQDSARRIICRKIDREKGSLTAVCLERNALRNFRIDRIQSAWSVETGEQYALATLPHRLVNGGLVVVDNRLVRFLTVLMYLIRCDQHVAREELEALEEAVTAYVLRYGGDGETVERGLDLAYELAPSDGDFLLAVKWIARQQDGRHFAVFIREWAHRIVIADGVLTAEEVNAGHVIDMALGSIVTGQLVV